MCSPLSFDPSIVEMFISIVSGCTLVIVPEQLKCMSKRLCDTIVDCNLTILQVCSIINKYVLNFHAICLIFSSKCIRIIDFFPLIL